MTNRSAGLRYARALFDVADREGANLDAIEVELEGFVSLMAKHPGLEKVLLNPGVPAPRKRDAVEALSRTLSPIVGKLLMLLAARDRLVILPDLLAAYRERLFDHKQIVRAEVVTALPLEADRALAIKRSLAEMTGRQVMLSTSVDPTIIGGLVARVGGTVYDASVTTQLKRMRQRLAESV
jgi:F-type H+-transporting ATPase subunit delta